MTDQTENALPPVPPTPDLPGKSSAKKHYYDSTVGGKLDMAKRETDSFSDEDKRRIFGEYGYDDAKIRDFVEVYNQAVAANSRQMLEFGEKSDAYAEFDKLFSGAKEEFRIIKKIVKLAFRNNLQKADKLGLSRKYSKNIISIFESMQTFYDNAVADAEVMSALLTFGFTKDKTYRFRDGFIAARDAHNLFFKEHSEAVTATIFRDEKIAVLDDWMMDYYTIAKIALTHPPQQSPA